MMLSNLVRLPVIFISGVFVHVEELPAWGRIISFVSPVTYVADLTRFAFDQSHFFNIITNVVIIMLFTILPREERLE